MAESGCGEVVQDIPVHPVETKYRRIQGGLPVPQTRSILEESLCYEPRSMSGQPPIVWDRAEGFCVYDAYGNQWLDFSSGVLVTNAGHGHKKIADAIIKQARHGLLHNYCFPNEQRIALARRLCELAPEPLKKAFLLSTGSEATECAIKLMRAHGRRIHDDKRAIISFHHAFHGRTLGAQMIGGFPALKEWIGNMDPAIVQVPFPDGFRCQDTSFALFEESLAEAGIVARDVAGVIVETYQGAGASFGPPEYFHKLRDWCDTWHVLLTFDEVQAAFGRCGKMWGFEHYGVVPDLMCLGKGISSCLPVSAIVGQSDIMDIFPPGSMTSTHTGNPICCAAALANLEVIEKEGLVDNAARMGELLHAQLWEKLKPFDSRIGAIHGKGLVAGIHIIKDDSLTPGKELAHGIVWHAVGRGLMLFSPVGLGGATIKICPPLCINEDGIVEGVEVLAEAFADVLA